MDKTRAAFVLGFEPESLWTHQKRYFSRERDTEFFGGGSFHQITTRLESYLEKGPAVVISAGTGNLISSELSHTNVEASILSIPYTRPPKLGPNSFNFLGKVLNHRGPAKRFLLPEASRESVNGFRKRFDPDYSDYSSYTEHGLSRPSENSFTIINTESRFGLKASPWDTPEKKLSTGPFGFYSRPEKFNDAVHGFLGVVEQLRRREEAVDAFKRNRNLREFAGEKR